MSAEVVVRERPILFSGPMVRAILDGRKTQTRRVLKFPSAIQAIEGGVDLVALDRIQEGYKDGPRPVFDFDGEPNSFSVRNPFGAPGDRLWVRETALYLRPISGDDSIGDVMYADHEDYDICYPDKGRESSLGWRVVPSIYMPRWASRLTLEITNVRVERIRDISVADCRAEGAGGGESTNDLGWRYSFGSLWDSINASCGHGWDPNPWVWVLEFAPVVRDAVAGR